MAMIMVYPLQQSVLYAGLPNYHHCISRLFDKHSSHQSCHNVQVHAPLQVYTRKLEALKTANTEERSLHTRFPLDGTNIAKILPV